MSFVRRIKCYYLINKKLSNEEIRVVEKIENIFTKTKYLYSVPDYYRNYTSDYYYILIDNKPIIAISKNNRTIIYDTIFFYSLLQKKLFQNI